jgi:hypothetical protein
MAETGPLVFESVTAARFTQMRDRAKASGIDITGNSGSVHKYGAVITYDYSPETQVLRLECTKTPFFLKTSDVYARLRLLVNENEVG